MPMNIDELFQECIRNIEALRDELRDAVIIEVAAPAPAPKPDDWHNPANVPAEQLPAGRRFMRRNEIHNRIAALPEIWVWDETTKTWGGGFVGANIAITYCVPLDWVDPHPSAITVFEDCRQPEPAPKPSDPHNPDNVPAEQLPAGRRFMRRHEIRERVGALDENIWSWCSENGSWNRKRIGCFGHADWITYCVPLDWIDEQPNAKAVFEDCRQPEPQPLAFPPLPAGWEWENPEDFRFDLEIYDDYRE